jgi:diguanylate cyclase (GGDEF)-like protein
MFTVEDLLGADPRRKLESMLAARCDSSEPFALLLVDLDHFEDVSKRHGAETADLLLYEVGSRIREKLRQRDVVRRSGPTQFAVFIPEIQEIAKCKRVARQIIDRLETSMTVSGTRFRLTATVGITLFPAHGDEWRALLSHADAAAYDAKAHGRGRISVSIPAVR